MATNILKTVNKGMKYMLSSNILAVFLYAIVTILLARWLDPIELGILMAAEAYTSLYEFFHNFGLKNSLLRAANQHEEGFEKGLNVAIGNALLLKLALAIPVSIIMLVIAHFAYDEPKLHFVIYAYTALAFFEGFAKTFGIVRRALDQFKLIAFVNVLNRFIRIAVIFTALVVMHGDVKFLACAFALFSFIRFLISIFSTIRLVKPEIDTSKIKDLFTDSIAYGFFDFLDDAQAKVDRVMISLLAGPLAVAMYSVPSKLNRFTKLIPNTVSQVFLPSLHKTSNQKESLEDFKPLLKRLTLILVACGIATALGIWFFAQDVLLLFFGEKYAEALEIAPLFAFINLIWFLEKPAQLLLAAKAQHKVRNSFQLSGLVTNILLNLWWIPKYGVVGAVYATILANGLKLVLLWNYSRKLI